MNIFKSLAVGAKKREASGPLSGTTLRLDPYQVKVGALIGEGGFASIYRAVEVASGAVFAVKHFRLSGDPEAERDVQTEVAVMRALHDCQHTLTVRAFGVGPEDAFVLLDMCGDTLAAMMIQRGSGMAEAEAVAAFLPVARAVAAMHALSPPLAHRDVKAENVLWHPERQWVLCDFGSTSHEQKIYQTPGEIAAEEERVRKQTTPAYRAPELWDLYSREPVGPPVDIWALGCLLYLVAYGRLPFDGDAKLQILNGVYRLPGGCSGQLEGLIKDMLVVDPRRRITAAEAAARAARLASGAEQGRPLPPSAMQAIAQAQLQRGQQVQQQEQQEQQRQRRPREEDGGGAQGIGMEAWGAEFADGAARAAAQHILSRPGSRQQEQEADAAEGWATFGSGEITPPSSKSALSQTALAAEAPAIKPVAAAPAAKPSAAVASARAAASAPPANPPPIGRAPASAAAAASAAPYAAKAAAAAIESARTQGDGAVAQLDSLRQERSDLQQHCQVLEQVLEERNSEVGLLRSQMERQAAESDSARRSGRREAEALRSVADQLRQRLAAGEAELERAKRGAAEAEALRGQVRSLGGQLQEAQAEAERLRQQLSAQQAGLAPASGSGSRPGSRLSGGSASGSLASFPLPQLGLAGDASPVKEGGKGRGGDPMRRQTTPVQRAPSPTKQPSGRSSREAFFSDLDPLA